MIQNAAIEVKNIVTKTRNVFQKGNAVKMEKNGVKMNVYLKDNAVKMEKYIVQEDLFMAVLIDVIVAQKVRRLVTVTEMKNQMNYQLATQFIKKKILMIQIHSVTSATNV